MSQALLYKAKREDLSRLAQYWTRDGLGILTGTASIFPLVHSWIALFLATNYQVHVVDCAIRFNVYRLIEEGNKLSLDIHKLLMTGKVQRAFTPYQILDVCDSILTEKFNPNKVYFILAPCKQFFDGDVKEQEGYFLLNQLITVFDNIQKKGIPFLVVESPKYKNKTFQLLFPILLELANTKWKYDKLLLGKEVFQRFQVYSKNSFIKNIEYELENSKGEEYGKNSRALFNGN